MKVHPPAIEARIKVSRLRRELIILINELTPGTVAVSKKYRRERQRKLDEMNEVIWRAR